MKIDKILNNNVVTSTNSSGEEVILMGRGIAFKKKTGDQVEEAFIQKEFVLKDSLAGKQMQQLFSDIPIEEIETVKKIVELAEVELQVELSPNIYITLTDHVHYAIIRAKEGVTVPNPLLLETQKFYPKEFEIAKKGIQIIKSELGVTLPDEEIGFITFHIFSSRIDNDNIQLTMQMTEIVRDAIALLGRFFGRTFNSQSLNYQRLITHLQYFVQRYLLDELSGEEDEFLFALVQSKYPEAFRAVIRLNDYLEKTYNKPIGQSEMIYLTIHVERVVNDKK